jgi:hypothetical protein
MSKLHLAEYIMDSHYGHWRFYPDAGHCSEEWGRRMGHLVTLVESFNVDRSVDSSQDFTMIFTNILILYQKTMSTRVWTAW